MNIKYQDIVFRYNGKDILKDISGSFESGKIHAIVGPNGSGKSTLLKCLDGILKPRKGSVYLDNTSLEDTKPEDVAKSIGYAQQNFNPVYASSVYNTVLLGRKPYMNWKPSTQDKKITEKVLNDFNLQEFAFRDFDRLSGGEKQRIHIARAMAQEPQVLLLDEPTSNLDIKHQIEIMHLLKKVADEGITVIIAIHDLNLAVRFADMFTLIKSGKIIHHGNMDVITEKNLEMLYEVPIEKVIKENKVYFVPGMN